MKYLLIVLIVCVAVSFNKVQSNENVHEDDASQNELDNIQKEELDAIDENAEDRKRGSNVSSCYCYNGGSPSCRNGRLQRCYCYNGYYGSRCQYGGPQTTRQPSPTSRYPCFCYNGGRARCSNGRLRSCFCFNGYHGSQCQYGPSTRQPSPTSIYPCFCYNGGRAVCSNGRLRYCLCYNGYHGRLCQFAQTTSRSFPTTARPSLTCYSCSLASSPRQCSIRTTRCFGSRSVCMYGRYTLKSSGRSYYIAGCGSSLNYCQSLCRNALKQGTVTYCSISCCQRDYCNKIVLSTTRRPPKTRTPNINSKFFLRLILKLLKSFKALIDVTSTLLKAHLKSNDAQFKKREIVSMMKRVDHTAQHLENSRDPEVINVKRDVDETRMRAQDLIAKLDDYIDDEPDKNKK